MQQTRLAAQWFLCKVLKSWRGCLEEVMKKILLLAVLVLSAPVSFAQTQDSMRDYGKAMTASGSMSLASWFLWPKRFRLISMRGVPRRECAR